MKSLPGILIFLRRKLGIIHSLIAFFILISLSACSLSFAGDVTPPPQLISPSQADVTPEVNSLPDQSQPVAGEQPTALPEAVNSLTITGKVIMVSGANIPAGLTADLQRFQMTSIQPDLVSSVEVRSDGSFHFEDVSLDPDQVLIVTVNYKRATFMSKMVHASAIQSGEIVDLSVDIYETTNDTSGLVADRAHFYFDLVEKNRLQVLEMYIITNPTDFYVLPPEAGTALIDFILPHGAENLQFEDQTQIDRYMLTPTGFADLESIPPGGQIQVVFAYDLPFEPPVVWGPLQWFNYSKIIISIPNPLKVNTAMVMAPSESLQLSNPMLVEAGTRNLQGMNIQVYTASDLPAGNDFEITIKSRHLTGAEAGTTPGINLFLGLVVFTLAVAVAVYWIFRTQKKTKDVVAVKNASQSEITQEALLDSILALDDLHTSGKISPKTYQERRSELKEQLRVLRDERVD